MPHRVRKCRGRPTSWHCVGAFASLITIENVSYHGGAAERVRLLTKLMGIGYSLRICTWTKSWLGLRLSAVHDGFVLLWLVQIDGLGNAPFLGSCKPLCG